MALTEVTKVWPPARGVAAEAKVTAVSESLTPSAATVSISDGLVVNGMLNGWKVQDLQSGIDALTDDGAAFGVSIHSTTDNYEWINNAGVAEKQPIIYYPRPLMGDFTIEVKFTNVSGNAYRMIFVGGFSLPSGGVGDTPNWSHCWGCRFGRHSGTQGKPKAGFSTTNGVTIAELTQQDWNQNHWLKLQRAGEVITASHKYASGSYAPITTADKFDLGGGASNVGIGFSTQAADSSEDLIKILQVDLVGYEWTDDPV